MQTETAKEKRDRRIMDACLHAPIGTVKDTVDKAWDAYMYGEYDLVATYSNEFTEYLTEENMITSLTEVVDHRDVTGKDVIGKNVIGKLGYSIATQAKSYTEIEIDLPRELIGQKLILTDYQKYAKDPVTYIVRKKGE